MISDRGAHLVQVRLVTPEAPTPTSRRSAVYRRLADAEPGTWVSTEPAYDDIATAQRRAYDLASPREVGLYELAPVWAKVVTVPGGHEVQVRRILPGEPLREPTLLHQSLAGARPGTWIIESHHPKKAHALNAASGLRTGRRTSLRDLGPLEARTRTIGEDHEVHVRRPPADPWTTGPRRI